MTEMTQKVMVKIARVVSGPVMVVVIWSVVAGLHLTNRKFLPSPWRVASTFASLVQHPFAGSLLQVDVIASLEKFAIGYLVGSAVGIIIGFLMARSWTVEAAVRPLESVIRSIPPIAWVTFGILWFGTSIYAAVLVIASGAFGACLVNTYDGVTRIPKEFLESAQVFGARRWKLVVTVIVPAAVPYVAAGLRTSSGIAWQSLIGAELIVGTVGLGYLAHQGQSILDTPAIFVALICIGVLGVIIDSLLRLLVMYSKRWEV